MITQLISHRFPPLSDRQTDGTLDGPPPRNLRHHSPRLRDSVRRQTSSRGRDAQAIQTGKDSEAEIGSQSRQTLSDTAAIMRAFASSPLRHSIVARGSSCRRTAHIRTSIHYHGSSGHARPFTARPVRRPLTPAAAPSLSYYYLYPEVPFAAMSCLPSSSSRKRSSTSNMSSATSFYNFTPQDSKSAFFPLFPLALARDCG